MKNSMLVIGLLLLLGCVSPRTLLEKGLTTNDTILINKAILKGATFNDEDLISSIRTNDSALIKKMVNHGITPNRGFVISAKQNNLYFTKFFVEKGASPSIGLTSAASNNNLDMVKYLIDKGANFSIEEDKEVIDGQIYLVNKSDPSNLIPITIVTVNGVNRWQMNDKDNEYLAAQANKGVGYFVKYKTKTIKSGNISLFFAIKNKNLQMVELLISSGYDVKQTYVLSECSDFRDDIGMARQVIRNGGTVNLSYGIAPNAKQIYAFVTTGGYICANQTPTPSVIMTPLQYAVWINADKSIIDAVKR